MWRGPSACRARTPAGSCLAIHIQPDTTQPKPAAIRIGAPKHLNAGASTLEF
jgi:hypothetical protein